MSTATISALMRSCHPGPTVAVTCFATVLGISAGNDASTCALLAVAILAGQLSIGWSNDLIDAARDRAVARTDKPVAIGELTRQGVNTAIAVALVATIVFSLVLGWRAGLLHLAAVGCGWLYNAWLKGTWLSWLPYALAFGALPGIATLARPDHPAPAAWVVAAGALFGVAANLTNALPDLAADRATGVVGLPHRLGARATLVAAVTLLISATACAAFGSPGPARTFGWVAFGVSIAVGGAGAAAVWQRPASRAPFYGIIGVVGLDLVLIVVAAHHLH